MSVAFSVGQDPARLPFNRAGAVGWLKVSRAYAKPHPHATYAYLHSRHSMSISRNGVAS